MDEKVSPPVEIYKHDNRAIKNMSYMQETDAWLEELILTIPTIKDDDENGEEIFDGWLANVKKQIKDRILESYKNGQKAALRAAAVSWPTQDSKGTKKPWFNRRKSRNG